MTLEEAFFYAAFGLITGFGTIAGAALAWTHPSPGWVSGGLGVFVLLVCGLMLAFLSISAVRELRR